MNRHLTFLASISCLTWISLAQALDAQSAFRSHPPLRPLPAAAQRPLATGPKHFVDARLGADSAAGTEQAPWRTLRHACRQLAPGDTLYLRGGIYFERVPLTASGTDEALSLIHI